MRIRYRDDSIMQDGGHTYQATNEAPEILTKLLDKIDPAFKIKNVGSICSGGEIPILFLAPRYENVIAVDNSRGSLMWAILKAQLLRNLPVADVRKLLGTGPLDITNNDLLKIGRRLARRGLAITGYNNVMLDVTGIWSKLTDSQLTAAAQSLGKIQFVHGDMILVWEKAAKDLGGLDLIYTSNAMAFSTSPTVGSRSSLWPSQKFADVLKPGGYLLSTSDPNADGVSTFDIVATDNGSRSIYTGGMHWNYWLGRKPLSGKVDTTIVPAKV